MTVYPGKGLFDKHTGKPLESTSVSPGVLEKLLESISQPDDSKEGCSFTFTALSLSAGPTISTAKLMQLSWAAYASIAFKTKQPQGVKSIGEVHLQHQCLHLHRS